MKFCKEIEVQKIYYRFITPSGSSRNSEEGESLAVTMANSCTRPSHVFYEHYLAFQHQSYRSLCTLPNRNGPKGGNVRKVTFNHCVRPPNLTQLRRITVALYFPQIDPGLRRENLRVQKRTSLKWASGHDLGVWVPTIYRKLWMVIAA